MADQMKYKAIVTGCVEQEFDEFEHAMGWAEERAYNLCRRSGSQEVVWISRDGKNIANAVAKITTERNVNDTDHIR